MGTARAAGGPGALVFAGGGEREAALAKSFWNSVALQPPLESRLGPARASAASASASFRRESAAGPPLGARRSYLDALKNGPLSQASATNRKGETETPGEPETEKVDHQKAQYLQKAKRREEILALLRKQREERIMKEAVSRPHKPKTKMKESMLKVPESDSEDKESVKALI